jgi:ComF family protein
MADEYIEPMPLPSTRTSPWPSRCELCRAWGGTGLCADCVARFAAAVPRCARCGLRLGAAAPVCGECVGDPPQFAATTVVADYGFPWDHLITQLKFHARPELALMLAPLLVDAVRATGAPLPALVLPVPLSPERLAGRGCNQAWELARHAAAALGLPARPDLLQRPLDTRHQAELTRAQRLANLRQAFMLDPRQRAAVAGLDVALVDDVMTTGATAREASAVLLRAGAARVQVWAFARTPARRAG